MKGCSLRKRPRIPLPSTQMYVLYTRDDSTLLKSPASTTMFFPLAISTRDCVLGPSGTGSAMVRFLDAISCLT